jgi:hypothetical protein
MRRKKGRRGRVGKIAEWSEAERSNFDFSFFPLGEAQTAVGGAFRNRYAKLNLKIKIL